MENFRKFAFYTFAGIGMLTLGREYIRSKRKISFKDKVFFVTGGSRGLGLELSRIILQEGGKLAIAARHENELEQAKSELMNKGKVLALQCDVTNERDLQGAIKVAEKELGPIDILINNAGKIVVGPLEEMRIDEYEESMNIHFWAPLQTMKAVVPGMKKRGGGRIANIASLAGKISIPHQVPYSAGKAAMVGLSTGFRAELIQNNIFVTTVIPGFIRTGAHKNAYIKGQHHEEYEWFSIADSNPLTSMSAENAATKILNAIKYGDAELVMPLHARLGVALEGILPGSVIEIFSQANKLLPSSARSESQRIKGKDIQPSKLAEYLSESGNKAAEKNNEFF